jgi:cold shock CspA family protein
MPTGWVSRFDANAGWGFIRPEGGGPDVFLHVKELARGQDPERIAPRAYVGYEVARTERGLKAQRVRLLPEPVLSQDVLAQPQEEEECEVLSGQEFALEVGGLITRYAQAFQEDLEKLARRFGWVEG